MKEAAAWPLPSLRQSFLSGALTRLIDPDAVLRGQIVNFVARGDFGLASGSQPDGSFERWWFSEPLPPEEVAFEADVFLLTKAKASQLREWRQGPPKTEAGPAETPHLKQGPKPGPGSGPTPTPNPSATVTTLRVSGAVPPESWNRLGTRMIPKLRAGDGVRVEVEFSVDVNSESAQHMETELAQILADLGLSEQVRLERS